MDRGRLERTVRYAAAARTYLRRAAVRLVYAVKDAPTDEVRWLFGYEADLLLREVLDAADLLVPLLDEDALENARERTRTLDAAVRAQALAVKLERVDGRTPEEAAAFQAKATALRSGVR